MMLRCLSRFDIRDKETEDTVQPKSVLNQDERTEIDEQREAGLPDYTPEPISDGEDGEDSVDDEADNVNPDNMDTATEEAEPDHSIRHQLPVIPFSQQRPQRERKRRRDDDLYTYT